MRTRWLLSAALAAALAPNAARAEVKPHALFSDGMVLQRGMSCPVWGTADPAEEVYVVVQQQTADGQREEGQRAVADKDGRWMVKLSPMQTGKPGTLTIKGKKNTVAVKNVLVGEVWVCSGQSNMEWSLGNSVGAEEAIKNSANPNIRLFTVPKKTALEPQRDVNAKWEECGPATVGRFTAVGYFFGRDLQKALNVPVGLIHTSWGGTPAQAWTSRDGLESDPVLKHYADELDNARKGFDPDKAKKQYEVALAKWKAAAEEAKKAGKPAPRQPSPPQAPGLSPGSPSSLYNGMIAPLIPFAIKGAIWYQGESNAGRAWEYRTLFPAMIKDWRKHWGEGDFPFLFVQLAPFMKISSEPQDSAWAELRDAQLHTMLTLKNTGMAVITDVGEENDIHPRKKGPVGARLAIAARGIAYGQKNETSGPIFKSMKVDGNKAILTFDHLGGGLEARGGKLTGFTVAGADKKFHNAEAVLQGDEVIVSSPQVEKPVAVRFGWANYPVVNLWNKAGLPASPFRTDDFPYTTQPKTSK